MTMRRLSRGCAIVLLAGCLDREPIEAPSCVHADVQLHLANNGPNRLDLLLVLDDSAPMGPRAAALSRALAGVAEAVVHPVGAEALASAHVAVVSADLGTHGTAVAGCTDAGDDGAFSPRACPAARVPLPAFLRFGTDEDDSPQGLADFACATDLGAEGCAVQQPLEAAWRALTVHAAQPGADPAAGFRRPDAWLAIVVISPQDDASVRDCRRADPGAPCDDATDVFDPASSRWAEASLRDRLTRYADGSPQDPTWSLDRYIERSHPDRGFTGLHPFHPERVVFAVATSVPLDPPTTPWGTVDWDALLATATVERPLPRRLIETARRFAETYNTGFLLSIERDDYAPLVRPLLDRLLATPWGRCLPLVLPTQASPTCCDPMGRPLGCVEPPSCRDPTATTVRCDVTELLSATTDPAEWCTAAHGRRRVADREGHAACRIDQIPVPAGTSPPRGAHGFYSDTVRDAQTQCAQRISYTRGDGLRPRSQAVLDCVRATPDGC